MTEKEIKISGLQRSMSRHMIASWTEVPQFHLEAELDCGALLKFRSELDFCPSLTTFFVKAVANTMLQHPLLNSSWREDHIAQNEEVNVSIAVDTKRGLMVPVITDVVDKTLATLNIEIENIKLKGKDGKFSIEELAGGTVTVSNLGMYRISAFTAIVNAPQAAILAIPRIQEVLSIDGNQRIYSKKVMRLNLSLDHRFVDGVSGSRFLTDLVNLLENPGLLQE